MQKNIGVMEMGKYAIGVDFGTQSGRAVLVELGTARELAAAVLQYPHGVMDEALPDGTRAPAGLGAAIPRSDYVEVLDKTVPEVLKESGVKPEDVIGIGIDFTACTMLPVDKAGTPLCMKPEWEHNPHSYVKLWKHHAAQDEANALNAKAAELGENFLKRYGGKISSEWMFPKIWQILNEAPKSTLLLTGSWRRRTGS